MSQNFHALTVTNIRKETNDTVSIALNIPNNLESEFAFKSGQYVTFKKVVNGEEIRRSYSICSAPHENELRVAVKQIENGLFSTFANKELKQGDVLDTMSPEGNFKVDPQNDEGKNYVLFAAGSGITPVISMAKNILNKDRSSNVYLYYGSKSKDETIFRSELEMLTENNLNLSLTYILSREDSGNEQTNGRIDESKCNYFFNTELKDLAIAGIYSCGPQEMVETVSEFFKNKGLLHKVHSELFTVTAPAKEAVSADPNAIVQSKVTVIIDDEEVELDLATDGKDILQAAQDAGADVPFSCKGGVCCTCKAKVMEGSAKMDLNYALDEEEVEEGFILTCQAHPTSEKCVVSYDEY